MSAWDPATRSGPILDRLLAGAGRARVLVVGDVMLDRYVHGSVDRQSPEAPVPVLRAESSSHGLGGAANVARQLSALRARVDLAGVVGDDEAGASVIAACLESSIGVTLLERDPTRVTTTKERLVASGHQLARVDREDRRALAPNVVAAIADGLEVMDAPHAVVISDYGKGVVSDEVLRVVMEVARRWKAPVMVDPVAGDVARYRGAALIKANQVEFEAAVGQRLGDDPAREVEVLGRALMAAVEVDELVVTLGERGMVVLAADEPAVALPSVAHEVFDVSGAGDTVMALLALGRAWGASVREAAALANEAAGIVVRRRGVAVAAPTDLVDRMVHRSDERILDAEALVATVAEWRAAGDRIVFTNGCFDLLHQGHLHLLTTAASLGDRLIVAVNTDRSVRALKGAHRPLLGLAERCALLSGLSSVDAVVAFDEDDPGRLVASILPDILVKGGDYAADAIIGGADVRAAGGEVVVVPLQPGWSTTVVAQQLQQADARP